MRLLVTGGSGYIGSVVVRRLLERGDCVTVFDNLERGHLANLEVAIFHRAHAMHALKEG